MNDEDYEVKNAFRRWKDFLRGKKPHLGPHTQHLFVIYDQKPGLHKGLGGGVFLADKLVFSQIGPLFIIGLLDRGHLPVKDLDVWTHSKINDNGGTITPVSEWRIGKTVTLDFANFLGRHEKEVTRRLFSLGKQP